MGRFGFSFLVSDEMIYMPYVISFSSSSSPNTLFFLIFILHKKERTLGSSVGFVRLRAIDRSPLGFHKRTDHHDVLKLLNASSYLVSQRKGS
jgi:hypothetical protein